MKKSYTNSFILNALNLPIIRDLDTFSNSIGVSKRLIYLLSESTEDYYKNFLIPKKNGEQREINTPTYSLKLVQRWILEEILEKIGVSEESMAFKKGPGNGIKKNAEIHLYSLYLLQLDIKDFFINIKRKRVFYLFRDLGYNVAISNILANLCTYKDYLPQGGITSPYLSNLICYKLDKRLKGLCAKRDILYTRYADDLTFSCDNRESLKKVQKVIEEIIEDEGFKTNPLKTRLLSPSSHKKVTGITVNERYIKANKKLKKKVRAMIHHAFISADYSSNDCIRGYIAFISSIEEGYKDTICKYINKLVNNKNYRIFEDIVEGYNNNKIFKDMEEMRFKETVFLDPDYPLNSHLSDIVQVRTDFLQNRDIKIDVFPDSSEDEIASANMEEIEIDDLF
ncbi:RNA-directed DNA polymerase (plasmid) [Bacillus mycoides]|uniref:retron St85 family RNA-directed DNA polymerase n=1 Tax=Bacillus mycoides TaxID=1405 RepID=UPI001C02F4CE|nr:retron St85 family RNA-directed DNA polymerase [Bacillus mycoides]QWG70405.1 RNA-directed DNA polymerase [Bacillus mycoides]